MVALTGEWHRRVGGVAGGVDGGDVDGWVAVGVWRWRVGVVVVGAGAAARVRGGEAGSMGEDVALGVVGSVSPGAGVTGGGRSRRRLAGVGSGDVVFVKVDVRH